MTSMHAEPAAAAVPVPRSTTPRALPAAVTALAAFLALGLSTGLLLGAPAGAGDNGDGARLWCGAGLDPLTPSGKSAWQGGVVLDFATGGRACADPLPSSALVVLRAVTPAGPGTWSLTTLGWAYLVAVVGAAALAAWAASARGPRRAALLAVPVLPLAEPAFGRFLISTYSEPAGLVGTSVLLMGAVVVAVTRRDDRAERVVALALVVSGGVLAGTAKSGYLPLLAAAGVLCLVTAVGSRGVRGRLTGIAAVVALVGLSAGPAVATSQWQARHYAGVNATDLVFSTVLPEVGPDAVARLGLPPAAAHRSGTTYFPRADPDLPGQAVITADPDAVRDAALRELATHPAALLRAVGVSVQATQGRGVDYLPSAPWTPPTVAPSDGVVTGPEGSDAAALRMWLATMAAPWWPSAVLLAGLAVGVATMAAPVRRRFPAATAAARIGGLCAATSLALAALAVLGDGYFEIAKHVWLAAYLVDTTVLALVATLAAAVVDHLLRVQGHRADA
ncbi:hypothetical protein ACFPM0_17645 [Pseudonocardia sulfidoxydans]|uniref:glycan biosynthesis hexose transferase WsfD n=1 Tax=Pseudonocardia sulfidoxydans TaxID=54011 RepID=UPI00361FE808